MCHVSHVFAQTLREKAAQRGSRERVREMALCVGEDIETSLVAPWRTDRDASTVVHFSTQY